ncbi:MAG: hypothetical protein K2N56_00945 [Oscillospiraceae bacterium]|nr:hypothetical protein [Oscillospiraceae bacterium]
MGLFNRDPLKKIFADYNREDHEDIFETAKLISGNDPGIVKAVGSAIDDPIKYVKENAERYSERGICLDDPDSYDELDADEFLFLGMLDELEEHGFAFEFDWKCELEDFLWGLEQTNNYSLIEDVIKTVELNEEDDIEVWSKAINEALGDNAKLIYINIDSDSYPVAIVTTDTLGKIPIPMVMAM